MVTTPIAAGISHCRPYDSEQRPLRRDDEHLELLEELRSLGARAEAVEIDLAERDRPISALRGTGIADGTASVPGSPPIAATSSCR
jgi:hypothetical protein